MPEGIEVKAFQYEILRGLNKYFEAEAVVSQFMKPTRTKETNYQKQFKSHQEPLDWCENWILTNAVAENRELVLVFNNTTNMEWKSVHFKMCLGAFWVWVHASYMDVIQPLSVHKVEVVAKDGTITNCVYTRVNLIFAFCGVEHLLVMVDCSTTQNMVQW
jgi:hypothetical protein